jgi:hypothetical protein
LHVCPFVGWVFFGDYCSLSSGAARKNLILLLVHIFSSTLAAGSDASIADGAWLQDGVRWNDAPRIVNPRLQGGSAAVLYFGRDQTIALIYRSVFREPKKYIAIGSGDPTPGRYENSFRRTPELDKECLGSSEQLSANATAVKAYLEG